MEVHNETIPGHDCETCEAALNAYVASHVSFLAAPGAAFDLILEHLPNIAQFTPEALAYLRSEIYELLRNIVAKGFTKKLSANTVNASTRKRQLANLCNTRRDMIHSLTRTRGEQSERPDEWSVYTTQRIIGQMIQYQILDSLLQSVDLLSMPSLSKSRKKKGDSSDGT